jgi:hypothetical protein
MVADGAVNLYRAGQALWEKIKGLLVQFKDWVMSKIVVSTNWATLGTIVKGALKFLLEELMKQAAPFVGAAMEIGTGIARTFEAAKTRLGAYLDRKKIRIVPGHPEELANSIETCMTHGILLGLADILKGVAKTAIAATLPGLGSLVAAVLTGVEWLIKLIYRGPGLLPGGPRCGPRCAIFPARTGRCGRCLKSAPSSHCSGTPAAVCRPSARNFLLDWMSGSVV